MQQYLRLAYLFQLRGGGAYFCSLANWIRGTKQESGFACVVIKGCCSNSDAVARLSTDSSKHRSRKSRKVPESLSRSLISGLPIVAMR